MNFLCIFGHKWKKWDYIKPIGRYEHKLSRVCSRCGKKEIYIGLTDMDIYGGHTPTKK